MPENDPYLKVLIARRRQIADRIVELELRAIGTNLLPPWEAGAHIDVLAADGLIRQYSIANDPAETDRYVLGVLLEAEGGRGGSAAMHTLAADSHLKIGPPRNAFKLHDGDQPALLLAGGIGITPLKAMAHALHSRGTGFQLRYFARSPSSAGFLTDLASSPFADRVVFNFDDAAGPPADFSQVLAEARGCHLYICGPTGFIDRVVAKAIEGGFASDSIHVERFSASPVPSSGGTFVVEATRSGKRVEVGPGETIAAALEKAGVPVLLSCEQGLCGTCLVHVLDGLPDHRDEFQSDEEKASNAKMAICCSRSLSPVLRLDI